MGKARLFYVEGYVKSMSSHMQAFIGAKVGHTLNIMFLYPYIYL